MTHGVWFVIFYIVMSAPLSYKYIYENDPYEEVLYTCIVSINIVLSICLPIAGIFLLFTKYDIQVVLQ